MFLHILRTPCSVHFQAGPKDRPTPYAIPPSLDSGRRASLGLVHKEVPPTHQRLRVAEFVFDPRTGEVWAPGHAIPIRLRPQSAKLLNHLAERPGQLVPRTDLQGLLWSDQCVDVEQGLNACVRDIRRGFDDRAAAPSVIETLPGRGYRLIAPVVPVTPVAKPARQTTRWLVRLTGLLGLALCGLLVVPFFAGKRSPSEESSTIEARTLMHEAEHLIKTGDPEALLRSVPVLAAVIELDPVHARAYGTLAQVSFLLGDISGARAYGHRALALDPDLAEAHAAVGFMAFYDGVDWTQAEAHLERAVQLDPASVTSRHAYAHYLAARGQHEEAVHQMLTAIELDPVNARLRGDAGWIFYWARRFSEAAEHARRALILDPDDDGARACLLRALIAGERVEAAAQVIMEIAAHAQWPAGLRGELEAHPANERIRAYWNLIVETPDASFASPSDRLLALAQLRRLDDAARVYVELSGKTSTAELLFLGLDPLLDPVRDSIAL